MKCRHDDPEATTELFGSWHSVSLEFQVDGKDRAIKLSGVVESPE